MAFEHTTDFAPTSLATQLFTTLTGIVSTLDGYAWTQVSKGGAAKQGTTSRAQAREALRDDLEAISRTARAMDDVAGLADKFRVPRPDNDQQLLNAARAFVTEATPLSAQFIAHEMPADFLDDLKADIANMEESISDQSSGTGQRIAAGAAIDTTIDEGVATVRKLDVIVKNKYRNNAAVLAQSTSASHTERDPRHRAAPATTAPGPTTPTA